MRPSITPRERKALEWLAIGVGGNYTRAEFSARGVGHGVLNGLCSRGLAESREPTRTITMRNREYRITQAGLDALESDGA